MQYSPPANIGLSQIWLVGEEQFDTFGLADACGVHEGRLLPVRLDRLIDRVPRLKDAFERFRVILVDGLDEERFGADYALLSRLLRWSLFYHVCNCRGCSKNIMKFN